MDESRIGRVVIAFGAAVFVYGVTFGVLSRSAGLTPLEATSMSALVFAGAAQFSTIATLEAGAAPWLAAATAIGVNLRLLPLGLATSRALSPRPAVRVLQCLAITDESVALASREDGTIDASRLVWTGVAVAVAWVTGTAIGAMGATLIADPTSLGLDAAFPAGFVALLAPRLREDPRSRIVALAGALIGLCLVPVVPVGVAPMVAGCAALLALSR